MSRQRMARLAIMLSPRRGDTRTELGRSLVSLKERIGMLFGPGKHLRIGTRCDSDPLSRSMGEARAPGSVEAAVEITGADGMEDELAAGAGDLGQLLLPLIDVSQAALTVGPTYRIVKPQNGTVFLSLSFKRYPGTSVADFRRWWLMQHAQVAAPLLPELLAYDQVHVDHELSNRAAGAAGLPYVPYDAYDNLTWESEDAFIRSTSDPQAMRTIYEDEVGHIDHGTYRGALMDQIASYDTGAT
jgi:EthD domain